MIRTEPLLVKSKGRHLNSSYVIYRRGGDKNFGGKNKGVILYRMVGEVLSDEYKLREVRKLTREVSEEGHCRQWASKCKGPETGMCVSPPSFP